MGSSGWCFGQGPESCVQFGRLREQDRLLPRHLDFSQEQHVGQPAALLREERQALARAAHIISARMACASRSWPCGACEVLMVLVLCTSDASDNFESVRA